MGRVVQGEPAAEDENDGGHDLDGQPHEVGVAADVAHREDHAQQHGQADPHVGDEDEGHRDYGHEGQRKVPDQLLGQSLSFGGK